MPKTERSVTTKQFASASGFPADQVRRRCREGRLGGYKKHGRWIISESTYRRFARRVFPELNKTEINELATLLFDAIFMALRAKPQAAR
jgi:hypothetical protein